MSFDRTMQFLSAGIYYSGLRHKLIANNIANINTPNYKAMDITFGDQIKALMKESNFTQVNISDLPPPNYIMTPYLSDHRPSIELNTVDIDQEQVKLTQNTLFHNSCLQLLSSKLRIIKSSISGNA